MGLALSGLASGFDWKSIVDQLIEVSRAPQNRMRKEQSANATKTAALNDVKSLLSSLKSSLSGLESVDGFKKKSVTFANSSTDWTASADPNTPNGSYTVKLNAKATAARIIGNNNITSPINENELLSTSMRGLIKPGYFVVNNKKIEVEPTDSFASIAGKLADDISGPNITLSQLPNGVDAGKAMLVHESEQINLGADTSGFFQALRLFNNGTTTITSSAPISAVDLSSPISSSKLFSAPDPNHTGTIIINGVNFEWGPNKASESLRDLINNINDSDAGVIASYDLANRTFSLTNKEPGNAPISVSDDTGDFELAKALGLVNLNNISQSFEGQDAVFTFNGSTFSNRSNTLDESVHGQKGLVITAQTENVEETITISSDKESAKSAINSFIEKYNAVQNAIEKYTKVTVDGTKVSSAVLAGSRELATISRELRRILYASQDANGNQFVSGSIQRLSDLGVGFSGIENTISITNSTTLSNRLASDSDDVIEYFTTADDGLVDRLDAMLDRLVSSSSTTPGTFQVQLDSISKQNKSLDKQIEEFERRLESQRSLLESSFIAMERAQSGFQQQSAYLQKTFSGNSK